MLSLAVVIFSLACHNVMCKAPIYSAACPGAPPDAGLPMARAHPPEARAITFFFFCGIRLKPKPSKFWFPVNIRYLSPVTLLKSQQNGCE